MMKHIVQKHTVPSVFQLQWLAKNTFLITAWKKSSVSVISHGIFRFICYNAKLFWIDGRFWKQTIFVTEKCTWYLWLTAARAEHTVYPKKYAHGFVVLCFVVVMQSFIMNSHEVFIHIHQGCFAGTGAIVRLPQCQWSKPDGYGKISQCITITKHSNAKTVCIFLGIYCISIA